MLMKLMPFSESLPLTGEGCCSCVTDFCHSWYGLACLFGCFFFSYLQWILNINLLNSECRHKENAVNDERHTLHALQIVNTPSTPVHHKSLSQTKSIVSSSAVPMFHISSNLQLGCKFGDQTSQRVRAHAWYFLIIYRLTHSFHSKTWLMPPPPPLLFADGQFCFPEICG